MALTDLGEELVLERVALAAFYCAQIGVLGALAVAILPLLVEILRLRRCRKNSRTGGGRTC